MAGFDEAWAAVSHPYDGENVSPELRPLLEHVYSDITTRPKSLSSLKSSLAAVLEYLADQGRTNANCWAADMFFLLSEGWEQDWTEQNLPDEFHDVLSLMGQALARYRADPRNRRELRLPPGAVTCACSKD